MATGKVLQFDHTRGYGFVAADDGGEDIFLHASAFDGDPGELAPGIPLEFQVMAGDRGRKAYAVHFTEEEEKEGTLPSLERSAQPLPAVERSAQPLPAVERSAQPLPAADDEQMCDVLSQTEFGTEITESLLRIIPALTGPQILEVRQGMVEFAKTRGWVDS
jgi:CspA family cold shock protein